ncbi:MAG: stage II sporulation protein M [Candidatus Woesearchaeota archaeon]
MKKRNAAKNHSAKGTKIRRWIHEMLSNRFVKIALILFFAGLFLGYSMRYLDFIKRPILENVGVIYPIHEQYLSNNLQYADSSVRPDVSYEQVGESPIDMLYVMRNNIISALILIATGVLIGIPSIIYLFIIGITAGASIPEVLEFAPAGIALKVVFLFVLYAIAVMAATSIGIELGKFVLDFIRGREIKIDKSVYDRALLVVGLVIANVILQYLLLVV